MLGRPDAFGFVARVFVISFLKLILDQHHPAVSFNFLANDVDVKKSYFSLHRLHRSSGNLQE